LRRVSLRLRLIIAGTAAIVVALGLAAAGMSRLFAAHVERNAITELSAELDQLLAGLGKDASGNLVVAQAPADPRFLRPFGGLYWQIEAAGKTLRSRSLWDFKLALPQEAVGNGGPVSLTAIGPAKKPVLVLLRDVVLPASLGTMSARVAVAIDRAELTAADRAFVADLLPYTALLGGVLILAGWAQVTIGLRPLATVSGRVAAVRSGRNARIGADLPSEVQPLAAEVDALLEEREQDIARARMRAGDLAHGLKTPLQALMGEAASLRDTGDIAAAKAIEEIVAIMRRQVDRELARARLSRRGASSRADVADVAGRVVRVARRVYAGIDWRLHVAAGLTVAADPDDLTEALGALAENAGRHADDHVVLTARREGSLVMISVTDDGPGIASDLREALMTRGERLDGPGTGLGLAIAAEIAEASGGSLSLHSPPRGLEARLTLPSAAEM
jgi:signal transduction histidine kinase